jgi:hypothetical protein
MRFRSILICLVVVGFLGWIGGGLYPLPSPFLDWVHRNVIERISSAVGGAQQTTAPSSTTATPAPTEQSSAPPATSGGAVDEATLKQYKAWIHEARVKYPYADSEERMYAVMMCESKGQAGIVNPAGPYSGLFQYSTATWKGDWNPYRDQSILDAKAQIFATAVAWQKGMQGQWGCYTQTH